MARISPKNPPEVFVSTAAMSAAVSRAVALGKLRSPSSRLYTTNRIEDAAALVRRHLWEIAAGFFPGGLVADRTALEHRRHRKARCFSSHREGGKSTLPGVTLRRARARPAPDDFTCATTSTACPRRARCSKICALRARARAPPDPQAQRNRDWLERFLRNSGKERLNALRDQIKSLAPKLKMEQAAAELDDIIGALLGTRDAKLSAPVARARPAAHRSIRAPRPV